MKKLLLMVLCLLFTSAVMAQDNTVPDLTGLNIPAAHAALNKVGMRLGTQTVEGWTEASGIPQNTVSAQSIAPGSPAEQGGTVDVNVLRSNNVRLMYDDNDLTMINLTDQPLAIDGLAFNVIEGRNASFSRWSGSLREKQCLQVWSISRNGPKGLAECSTIQNWVVTTRRAEHFWTTSSGATTFEITLNGEQRGTCPAAGPNTQDNPLTCEFFIPANAGDENATFMYLMYNTEQLIVKNPTPDKWMRTNQTVVFNQNPNRAALGDSFNLGNRNAFGNPDIVANIRVLAPGQCLVYKAEGIGDVPLPEDCDVIAARELPAAELFWLFNFEFSTNEGKRYSCPAAVADKRTLCIMPTDR